MFRYSHTMTLPYARQLNDYYCGPAVVHMMLQVGGITKGQHHLSRKLKTHPKSGTSPTSMMRVFREHGFRVSSRRAASLVQVKRELDKNTPVIILYIEPSSDEGHYSIITKLDHRTVTMHDPWNGHNFRVTRPVFLRRWRSGHGEWRRWMMTAVPRG